ncbi:hypothetical protein FISHEDRAFT_43215 [Fistulina hepatica ATCC 64428]|uniref:Uncharacterized protein n=1 Tax=Fistulina hepatica ATCC 64428 TaxID=1128425 RepID=A0A0D7ACP4_9AGAR|nr:hypothetical protein FISHEDRAFT_43215 [Fistulina hepatica ATCC 64428]
MEHILFACRTPGQAQVWKEVSFLFREKGISWRQPNLGEIIACATPEAAIRDERGKIKAGLTRFKKIVLTEASHLIWKLRCDRVIRDENEPLSEREIKNRWRATVTARLHLDASMTDRRRYNQKAIRPTDVINTWSGVLQDEVHLPRNWIRNARFLVGIAVKNVDDHG